MNLPSYVAGMVFHAGVFTAFGLLLAALVGRAAAGGRWCCLARVAHPGRGAWAALSLLVKRLLKPQLRGPLRARRLRRRTC